MKSDELKDDGVPEDAEVCSKCEVRAVIKTDGRLICLCCGAVCEVPGGLAGKP